MALKIIGMAEEGHCDHCGTMCPRRRVAVQSVNADGSTGVVEFWGVVCAGQVRYGSRSTSNGNRVRAEAETADRIAAANAAETERRFIARTSGHVPEGSSTKQAANIRYHRTGRSIVGSYFLENAEGNIVRVDGTDAEDVELYTSRGYTKTVSTPVQPQSIPA